MREAMRPLCSFIIDVNNVSNCAQICQNTKDCNQNSYCIYEVTFLIEWSRL